MKVRHWISSVKDRLDTLNQLFKCAAASVFQPDHNKREGQPKQRQKGDSQKDGEKIHNFQHSISEPVDQTPGNLSTSGNSDQSGTGESQSAKLNKSTGGTRANISPVKRISKQVYKRRKANRPCTCPCSRDQINLWLYHIQQVEPTSAELLQ